MAINAQNRSLPDWFTRIRTRQTVLPRFQRFQAWGHSNVTQLFNTVLQGLPVGAVLVLEVGDKEPFISRPLHGAPETGERITEHLLDGQQRLTALWRGMHNNYEDRTYFLYLQPDEETGMPYYVDTVGRWKHKKDDRIRPLWANDPIKLWERRMIPLDLCAPGEESLKRFREWARIAIPNGDEREPISDIVSQVRQSFATFNMPFLSLPVTTKKETALDVFIKMNTSAAPLTTFDIVVAQVEAGLGESLHDLVAETKERCPLIAEYYTPEVLVLNASALLQERPPTNATYMSDDFGQRLLDNWDTLIDGIAKATAFLEEERIFDSARLPTDVIMPVLSALWARAPDGLDSEGHARSILRKYLWRAVFSSRYEKSTNFRALTDYNELLPLVTGAAETKPVIFDGEQFPLPEVQELKSAGWPKKKDRLARAILALAIKTGGLDLADGSTASRGSLARREYHHLFPDAHLKKQGVEEQRIFRSLNCALVTWKTNRNISAKEPERYLAERRTKYDPGEATIKERLTSHLIPYDEMVAGDYEAFLTKRAEMVREAMIKVCDG